MLYYRVSGSGSPVLLLHGLAITGTWWDSIVPQLAIYHTVIVPDLRGHGRSTNPSGRFTHSIVADDLISLLDSLKFNRVSAVGHSSGAAALLHLASRAPALVDRMIVIGMGATLTDKQRVDWRNYPTLDQIPSSVRSYLLSVQPGGADQVNAILSYARALGADTTDINFTPGILSRISASTLVIGGDRDGHTVENVMAVHRSIPKSRLWIVPGQAHFPFWPAWGGDSTMARIFPTVVREFLASK